VCAGKCKPSLNSLTQVGQYEITTGDEWDGARFLLVFDEANTLIRQNYYNSFRWALDYILQPAWERGTSPNSKTRPLPFMAIFLGTNSKVADFIPPGEFDSYRYYIRQIKVLCLFTSPDWDVHIRQPFTVRCAGATKVSNSPGGVKSATFRTGPEKDGHER
jgi:hypothetical protein